jgi:hypothetical protein
MAQRTPEENVTLDQVVKLVDRLTAEDREQLLDRLKMEKLRRSIQIGIDQADKGQVVDGDQVFKQMRERNAAFKRKGNQ